MLKLTPLEETRVGRELIEQGIEQAIEQGEVMILVRLIARKFDVEPDVVSAILRRLRRQDFEALTDLVLDAETFAEIHKWINARTQLENGHTHVAE
jgi:hypothetical protein